MSSFIKNISLVLVILLSLSIGLSASARDVYVRGYTKSNGTYVAPHHRSSPDSSLSNNYSTRGNTNPYTGKAGTVNPYGSSNSGQYNSNSYNSSGSYRRY